MEWHSKCLSYLFIRSKCRRYDEEIKIRGVHGSDWFSLRRLRSNQIILVTHFVNSSKIKLILFGLFWILIYRKKKFFLLLVNISHRQNWVGSIRMYPLVHPFVMAYGADLRLFPAPTCKLTAQGWVHCWPPLHWHLKENSSTQASCPPIWDFIVWWSLKLIISPFSYQITKMSELILFVNKGWEQ